MRNGVLCACTRVYERCAANAGYQSRTLLSQRVLESAGTRPGLREKQNQRQNDLNLRFSRHPCIPPAPNDFECGSVRVGREHVPALPCVKDRYRTKKTKQHSEAKRSVSAAGGWNDWKTRRQDGMLAGTCERRCRKKNGSRTS